MHLGVHFLAGMVVSVVGSVADIHSIAWPIFFGVDAQFTSDWPRPRWIPKGVGSIPGGVDYIFIVVAVSCKQYTILICIAWTVPAYISIHKLQNSEDSMY